MSGILHLFCMSVIIHDEKTTYHALATIFINDEKRKENKDNLDVWIKKDKNNTNSD